MKSKEDPPIVSILWQWCYVKEDYVFDITSNDTTLIAAPIATYFYQWFTDLFGSLPVSAFTASTTVDNELNPPTRITSSISTSSNSASERPWTELLYVLQGHESNRQILARVKVISWRGPASPAKINGKLISVGYTSNSFCFFQLHFSNVARFHLVSRQVITAFSEFGYQVVNDFWSKSSPPVCCLAVDNTSKTPSPNSW